MKGICEPYRGSQDINAVKKQIWENNFSSVPAAGFVTNKCRNKWCIAKYHLKIEMDKAHTHYKEKKRRSTAKLTNAQAEEIRKTYAALKTTQKELAKKYRVAQRTICLIVRGETYK